jgi:predicted DNA-binding transcriptional regulator AlpA
MEARSSDQHVFHSYFEDALKRIVYDAVRTVFEQTYTKPEIKEISQFFGVDTCEQVTGLAKPTIYRNTSKNLMPHYRRDGKLLFNRDEVYSWMTENKVKTQTERLEDLDRKLGKKKGAKA